MQQKSFGRPGNLNQTSPLILAGALEEHAYVRTVRTGRRHSLRLGSSQVVRAGVTSAASGSGDTTKHRPGPGRGRNPGSGLGSPLVLRVPPEDGRPRRGCAPGRRRRGPRDRDGDPGNRTLWGHPFVVGEPLLRPVRLAELRAKNVRFQKMTDLQQRWLADNRYRQRLGCVYDGCGPGIEPP
jgi:hypothetical protein